MKKKISWLLCSWLFTLPLAAQIKISGTIQNGSGNVSVSPDPLFTGIETNPATAALKAEKFEIQLSEKQSGGITLTYGDKSLRLFAKPGDEIQFNASASNFPADVTFTGKNAAELNVLKSFSEKFGSDFTEATMKERILTNQLDYFETTLYENHTAQKKFIEQNSAGLSEDFLAWMKHEIRFHYLAQLMAYPIVKAGEGPEASVKDLPAIMLEAVKPEFITQDEAFHSREYRNFLLNHSWYMAHASNGFNRFANAGDAMVKARDYAVDHLTPLGQRWFLTQVMIDHCDKAGAAAIKSVASTLEQADNRGPWWELASTKCAERMAMKEEKADDKGDKGGAKAGVKSYPFYMVTAEGKKLSFDDYKGKVIYVDFWASWCGPCRAQAPFAKQLKELLTPEQRKQIVFMYISIDEDEAAWKNAVEKLGLEGVHTLSPASHPEGAGTFFKVQSIPRYMILNQKGEIVNPNAPRPGDQDAYDQLIKLLK